MKKNVYSLGERLMLYLPLMLMTALAIGTYWMVRTNPLIQEPEEAKPIRHEPDYMMQGFSVKTFDTTGRMRAEVQGDIARHYPDTMQLEIEDVRMRSLDQEGRVTTATALRGLTNQDSSEVQLIGDARVVREADPKAKPKPTPRMEYRSELLHVFMNTEQVRSNVPVELLRGKDRMSADSLEFDNIEQVVQMQGRVRATLHPE